LKPQIAHQRSTTVHNVASGKMNLGNAWHKNAAAGAVEDRNEDAPDLLDILQKAADAFEGRKLLHPPNLRSAASAKL
jgi:hypothetical protein